MIISIIIAVKTWQRNLEQCISKCLELDYPDFEIIILPDYAFDKEISDSRVRVIPTGEITPPYKRDIGLSQAKGEILAFIDDDAYPVKNWLINAVKNFLDPEVAAVGGPAITPDEDNVMQKASGLIYSSFIVGSIYAYRYIPKKRMEIDDYPTCNLLIRRQIMYQAGGFKVCFWPGEDTKLCLEITKELHKKIIYDPEVLVYHHRRMLFAPHLKQIANYALHRGYFVKIFPETSFKFAYFVPSIFLVLLVLGSVLTLFPFFRMVYLVFILLYLIIVFFCSLSNDIILIPLVLLGSVLTHVTYGVYFLKGLFLSKLKEEK